MIDFECIISLSLVTDNVGFNRIKYEYSLCCWQIDYEMKSKSVPCVKRELSWQNSCIRVPQSEWANHRHNFTVFMYLVYFSFTFRNGTILAVSQHIAIGIWRKVVWYTANDTPGNPYIAHPYPQLTTPTRISLEKSFPEKISGPSPRVALAAVFTLTSGWCIPYRYVFGLGMSQEETVHLFEFAQASFEISSTETWTPVAHAISLLIWHWYESRGNSAPF